MFHTSTYEYKQTYFLFFVSRNEIGNHMGTEPHESSISETYGIQWSVSPLSPHSSDSRLEHSVQSPLFCLRRSQENAGTVPSSVKTK